MPPQVLTTTVLVTPGEGRGHVENRVLPRKLPNSAPFSGEAPGVRLTLPEHESAILPQSRKNWPCVDFPYGTRRYDNWWNDWDDSVCVSARESLSPAPATNVSAPCLATVMQCRCFVKQRTRKTQDGKSHL